MRELDLTTVVCRTRDFRVDRQKIRQVVVLACAQLALSDYQVSVTFVGPRSIRRLNREFRGKDRTTDVLAFPQQRFRAPVITGRRGSAAAKRRPCNGPPPHLGDVVISLTDAARNARAIGQPLAREACFLIVHGLLHLCGHDHQEPVAERRMLREQRILMKAIGGGGARSMPPFWHQAVRRRARAVAGPSKLGVR